MTKPAGSDSKKKPAGSDQKKKPVESDSKKKLEGPGPSKPIGPGPGEYMLPTTIGFNKHDVRKQRMPMYSLKERFTVEYKSIGKGPAKYNLETLTRYGVSRGNRFVIGDRTFPNAESDGPGPAEYRYHEHPILKGTTAPAYTMRERHVIDHEQEGPGPAREGDVNVAPIKPRAPAYHCGERIVIPKKPKPATPGPADHVPPRLGLTLPNSPQFIMTSREPRKPKVYNPKTDGEYRMYDLMYYRPGKKAPAFFMGDLHSRFKLPTTVDCDNI